MVRTSCLDRSNGFSPTGFRYVLVAIRIAISCGGGFSGNTDDVGHWVKTRENVAKQLGFHAVWEHPLCLQV